MEGPSLSQSIPQTRQDQAPNDLLNIFRDDAFIRNIPTRENADAIPLAWRVMPPQFSSQQSFPEDDHFDFQDMQEVARFRKPGSSPTVNNYDRESEAVILALPEEVQKSLSGDLLKKKRLQTIFAAYLKDIRDELETRERLLAPAELGGMGFEPELILRILKILKNDKEKPNAALAPLIPKQTVPVSRALELSEPKSIIPAPLPLIPKIQRINQSVIQALQDESENALYKPKIPQPPRPEPISARRTSDHIPIIVRSPTPVPHQTPRIGPAATNRARISDIAARAPALTKPSDEFSAFDIEDLRREQSANIFIEKVVAHIQTLSESDYHNRAQAIAAWKRSPLYARYLTIGAKSLAHGKEVREYIAGNNNAELTYEEFEAIAALNQRLRF